MPLYCIAENPKGRVVRGLRDACEARGVQAVVVDPLGDWEAVAPGPGDAIWRCSSHPAARRVEIALVGDEVLHPFESAARARTAIDDVPAALEVIGFPVRPTLRVGRPRDRDRLRAQVERLGGFPVTLIVGRWDGHAIPVAAPASLFSIVDYLDHCGDPLWLVRGDAWHARREVYVCGDKAIGGVDTSSFSRRRRPNRPGPDDRLAEAVAEALGLRFARVVLSWDGAQRPHLVDAGFPTALRSDVAASCTRAAVDWLVSQGMR